MKLNTTTAKQAFTLMELMIVIVIIGILAAVGMVTFGGQAEKAKIAATKANHQVIVKFMTTQIMNCSMGETNLNLLKSNGSEKLVSCNKSLVNTITLGSSFVNHFWGEDLQNPFGIVVNGKTYVTTGNSPYLGQTQIVHAGGTKILIRTKFSGDQGQWKGDAKEILSATVIDTR